MPFTAKLLMLSPVLLYFIIIAVFLGISLGLFFIITRLIHYQTRQRDNVISSSVFNRIGAMYGVLLAFVVVVMWQQYGKAVDNASREGTAALGLYRDLNLYPDKEKTDKAIKSLVEFVRKVVKDEFPAMVQMKDSQATEEALSNLWSNTEKISPQNRHEQVLYNVILGDLNNLSKLRQERLLEMESNLPGIVWGALIIGAFITIISAILIGAEKLWLHAVLTSMLAILIATILFLIIELDYPFIGELSVKPSSYLRMLEIINHK